MNLKKQWQPDAGVRVRVSGLEKSFGAVKALDSVDLEVEPGTTLVLLGPSGCGKTTLLRSVAGLERPDAGTIEVDGRMLFGSDHVVAPKDRNLGMVFQEWALFPHMSVAQNVAFGADNDKGVDELLELVGMAGLGARMPSELSGGQQQRVALARALARRPPLLLFDEPFSNLDAELRRQLRLEVAALLRRLNVSAIFVTHDQEEAFVLADEVALMRDGRVVQQASPRDLYERPKTTWAANFVGDANLLEGVAVGDKAETAVGPIALSETHSGSVRVLLRPEALLMHDGESGTVASVEYYGHDAMHQVILNDGTSVKVRTNSFDIVAPGSTVDVTYQGNPSPAWP
jgi:iron(III) transport system ATP-binding protein